MSATDVRLLTGAATRKLQRWRPGQFWWRNMVLLHLCIANQLASRNTGAQFVGIFSDLITDTLQQLSIKTYQ